ncbi:MAG: AI-2E family transporter, partial [Bacillota bacterium]|nr:AI-2E family transporter [Bacillota bacterium]
QFAGNVLAPFIYGLVMAYLICPIYNATVRGTYSLLNRGEMKLKHDMELSKSVGTVVSVLVILIVLGGVFWMIIPGLINSIVNIVDILPGATKKMSLWIEMKLSRLPVDEATLDSWLDNLMERTLEFVTKIVLPHSQSLASSVSQGVMGVMGFLMDFVIGIIISVYFLNSKDTFLAQIKKVIVASFREKTAEEIFHGAAYTNRTFGGFISGKIIDSIIIGIICFLVMSIFHWEYALLISCIVGLTNIIPFFGPFIGAIPSTLLLLMVSPIHAVYFIIFVLFLQQFDGNILGPKILGESTGLESFWVLFAVLVGGGLFGFIGMVIGIPVFAVIYYYLGRALNHQLRKKGYSTDLNDYRIDPYRIKTDRKKRKRFRIQGRKKENGRKEPAETKDDPKTKTDHELEQGNNTEKTE